MSWLKICDSFADHPKVVPIVFRRKQGSLSVWVLAGAWCRRHSTGGFVPADALPRFNPSRFATMELVEAGLWIEVDGGYRFHDWAEWNPVTTEDQREIWRRRKRRQRAESDDGPGDVPRDSTDVPAMSGSPTPTPTPTDRLPPMTGPPAQPELELITTEPTPDLIAETWALFRELHAPPGRPGPDPVLTRARKTRIRALLREGSQDDLAAALRGALADPWIMGVADGSSGYRRLETILRDRGQVERLGALDGQPEAAAAISGPAPPREAHEFEDDDLDDWLAERPEGMKSIIPANAKG